MLKKLLFPLFLALTALTVQAQPVESTRLVLSLPRKLP